MSDEFEEESIGDTIRRIWITLQGKNPEVVMPRKRKAATPPPPAETKPQSTRQILGGRGRQIDQAVEDAQ